MIDLLAARAELFVSLLRCDLMASPTRATRDVVAEHIAASDTATLATLLRDRYGIEDPAPTHVASNVLNALAAELDSGPPLRLASREAS